jgi:UDP-glucose 6-dehydrogenase
MMSKNIGWVGLGKLGTPCAVAVALMGHDVMGYDIVPENMTNNPRPYRETAPDGISPFNSYLERSTLHFGSLEEVANHAELIFVACQTPHAPMYEGTTRIPDFRADFDYTYLTQCIKDLAKVIKKNTVVAVISTVLPGTIRREVIPCLTDFMKLVYSPMFIAMGTTMRDFLNPEFWLLGVNDPWAAEEATEVFKSLCPSAPVAEVTVEEAEAIKVFYNTAISTKIALANTWMEMAHKLPNVNVDTITDTLALATRRVNSFAYMRGGMGDGGCIPPDELVYTEQGLRPIIDVELGDNVLGGDGKLHSVVHCFERHYQGDILEIKVRGRKSPVRITPNHKVYVAKDTRTNLKNQKVVDHVSNIKMIPAGELTTDYYIVFPVPSADQQVPLPEYVDSNYLDLSGYYLSEGSLGKSANTEDYYYNIQLAFGSDEVEYIKESSKLLETMCPNNKLRVAVKSSHDTATDVEIGNRTLTVRLLEDFSRLSVNKKFPNWVLYGSDNVAKKVLRGAFRGDGCFEEKGFAYTSVSHDLASGIHFLLLKLGIRSTLRFIDDKRENCRRCYYVQVRNYNDCLKLQDIIGMRMPEDYERKRSMNRLFIKDGHLYSKIESIKHIPYNGMVHNIEVQDTNNFVTVTGLKSNSCHPRDNIALSWLAHELDLSYDWFDAVMHARECQAEWLCNLMINEFVKYGRGPSAPDYMFILGYSFKKESNITVGSPALLCKSILEEWGYDVFKYDPHVEGGTFITMDKPTVILIGVNHPEFVDYKFRNGSVVIDPWRYIPDQKGVEVIRVGE